MTPSDFESETGARRRAWTPGLRGRLLLAFFAIAAFSVLGALAALHTFREVGEHLDLVDARVPPALSALALSRSAERIIATAPALLASADRARRDAIEAELATEAERLTRTLRELGAAGTGTLPFDTIEPIVTSLTAALAMLQARVARRLESTERIAAARREVFRTSADVQRLLAPWSQILDGEVVALIDRLGETTSSERTANARRLASVTGLQRSTRAAGEQVSLVMDLLGEASTTARERRLPILDFQLGLALRKLERISTGLDPRLRAPLQERVSDLRRFVESTDSIVAARTRELALLDEGERLLAETSALSVRLNAAIDRLGLAARQDVDAALGAALRAQRLSARTLFALVSLSLLGSVLIAWLYVGRNLVRRLTALGDDMLAISGGRRHPPIDTRGGDEIAAMGRALEILRRNTVERDELLRQQERAAERLEREVEQRTAELATADAFKSRFLAAASHDLRQPLHALNLFVAQLRAERSATERQRLVGRIDASVITMNELFEALLDMAKLDAGILEPDPTIFPAARLLERLETTFTGTAREKGLRLRVVPSRRWVRGDAILLERILFNLVANAVRYTSSGGVLIGCRVRGGRLRFDVIDSGAGIAHDRRDRIFDEYYRLSSEPPDRSRSPGLGLGLAIVERLARLLDCPVELDSRPGRGSRFSVSVALAPAGFAQVHPPERRATLADPLPGKSVLVIDDDDAVLEGMGGLLRSWGCIAITAPSAEVGIERLARRHSSPDLIISDYRLADGRTGIEAIARVRRASGELVPAFLISGDTAPAPLQDASASGFRLLHKPLSPMRLRAVASRLLRAPDRDP